MPGWFTSYMRETPERFGTLLALAGILTLTPDTLVIRLSELERWSLMGWRGIFIEYDFEMIFSWTDNFLHFY